MGGMLFGFQRPMIGVDPCGVGAGFGPLFYCGAAVLLGTMYFRKSWSAGLLGVCIP
jgi:ribonuclease HIII